MTRPRWWLHAVPGATLLLNSCALLSQPDGARVRNPALDELSGLAISHADPTLLWGHNDSGDGPNLFRIGVNDEDYGRIAVAGARAVDWEDIAAFDWQGQPALLVADTGENTARREVVTLTRSAIRAGPASRSCSGSWTSAIRTAHATARRSRSTRVSTASS